MLFNPNAPLENNSYLQLDTNIRVEKVKINQNGNGAVLLKILENGTFQKKLFLIKDKNFLAYPNNHEKINDFTLDNETLLGACITNRAISEIGEIINICLDKDNGVRVL